MGRAASRKWVSRARRFGLAGAGERVRLRALFGGRLAFWAAVGLALLVVSVRPAAGQIADVCTGPADATICTGPITASMRFEWIAPDNVLTPALSEAMIPRVRVDGATTFVELTGETCAVTQAPAIRCTAAIPAGLLAVMNVAGAHSVTMRIFDPAQGIEGPSAVPFALRSPPAAPTGVRIVR